MNAGLDAETLDMVLDAIGMFAEGELPDARLLELDAADEFPEEIVRGMCGEQLGISLLFVPEDQPPQPAPRLRWTIHHPCGGATGAQLDGRSDAPAAHSPTVRGRSEGLDHGLSQVRREPGEPGEVNQWR